MHFLSFAYKRAHYTALAVARPFAQKFGLTPARFDFFYCVRQLREHAFQAEIARWLGVSQVTVSRMARALEKRGLVRREKSSRDRRKQIIVMTNDGRRPYYLVLRKLQRFGLHRIFRRMIMKFNMPITPDEAYIETIDTADLLRAQMQTLGCRAKLRYPDWNIWDH
ncbi:MAG: MarR family transcriptional regulator [Polyangiaceae bacterium]